MSGNRAWDQDSPASLSQHQWQTLLAIADGVTGQDNERKRPLSSQCNPFVSLLRDVVGHRLPLQAASEIKLFLTLVGGYTSYAFNGTSQYLYDLSRDEVERVVLGWQSSRLFAIRAGAKGIGQILRALWLRTCPGLLQSIGHPGHIVPDTGDLASQTLDDPLSGAADSIQEGLPVKQILTGLLVIGSGSGASSFVGSFLRNVANHDWSEALRHEQEGFPRVADVLIVEKGSSYLPHAPGAALPANEAQASDELWDSGGVMTSNESGISVLAASTWGGGSRINWSACLQTDRIVREEWTKHMMSERGMAKEIIIGDNVWIGGSVVIVGPVKIGHGSTIGAGSVVTKDIPDRCVAVGNPARVIKTINLDGTTERVAKA